MWITMVILEITTFTYTLGKQYIPLFLVSLYNLFLQYNFPITINILMNSKFLNYNILSK